MTPAIDELIRLFLMRLLHAGLTWLQSANFWQAKSRQGQFESINGARNSGGD
jgi:hypothetical protein